MALPQMFHYWRYTVTGIGPFGEMRHRAILYAMTALIRRFRFHFRALVITARIFDNDGDFSRSRKDFRFPSVRTPPR